MNWRAGKAATASTGPAILGFNSDIKKECGEKKCDGYNRLYLGSEDAEHDPGPPPEGTGWSICKNMLWVLCAGKGLLPDQGSASEPPSILFATAPKDMDATPYHWGTDKTPSAEDMGTTVHEVCTIALMCDNKKELFTLDKGATFVCQNPKQPEGLGIAHSNFQGESMLRGQREEGTYDD